ncbi:putative L-amino-acid oxidase YobN isoform X1 [Xenia sp. Carnegie-2017]|uniref:putative L-amino-acid oxidase YobN isoform X1 n=1 Tax=Xenia sp. Carnegie-2017 TaxID=2897299 RepID=UPI001F04546E|nr:putative L-amino-acid oxidase YobN isoform X1 [Xenia sp. Carnegie-2017]
MAASFLEKNKNLLKNVKTFIQRMKEENKDEQSGRIQQSDYLKNFLECIRLNGLHAAYEEYGDDQPDPNVQCFLQLQAAKEKGSKEEYDVIIVGAGMTGISAAYELKKAGLNILILEQTERIGGRVFTYDESNSDLASGIFAEAGAMRLPGKNDDPTDRMHYLTDGYIKDFNLKTQPFPNYDENGISKIYEFKAKTSEWADQYFDTVWPRWREGIKPRAAKDVENIDAYYNKTTGVVTDQLRAWLTKNIYDDVNWDIKQWDRWIRIWSQFTLESFLESNLEAILAKVKGCDRDDLDLITLGNLLPWSNDALRGYSVSSYTEQLDQSLVQYLRDQLGGWWSENMHCLIGGMETLPKAFFSDNEEDNKLDKNTDIALNQQVSKIAYTFYKDDPNMDSVTITCYSAGENKEIKYQGKAALVTTPVNILRQITFKPESDDVVAMEALRKTQQAIEDIFTGPSTKIFIQTKRRFWEDSNIQGGFSKTNLPIGQIHYVKPELECQKKGLLLIYTWKSEALIFGSLSKEQVQREVIEQIAEIHPEINEDEMVEKCIVHSWYNKPSYQGAYALLKTTQYDNIRYLWEPTLGNVYFAGENLSFTNGWIQGALESGLKTAYQVYQRHMYRQNNV